MTENFSYYLLPSILLIVSVLFFSGRRDYLGSFMRGAKGGLETALSLIPPLVLIMCAVSMFSSSGASSALSDLASPFFRAIGIPVDILPLLLTRPFSGSASSAAFIDLMDRCGADGYESFIASVIMGSSDTLFYIIPVYFSAVPAVRRTKYVYPVAIASSVFCVFFSNFICRLFY